MLQKINSKKFVNAFYDVWNSTDRRFCFVLGAGASKTSEIKTGGELAQAWLQEIERDMDATEYADFLEKNKIDINNPGGSYAQIYEERFRLDVDSGFERVNKELENANPGYGYSVLAQILAEKQHNIVITTNFDNLTEEALYVYTHTRPLVCGHESLAAFATPSQKRPLIVKIHRDRFLNPQNRSEELNAINSNWVEALNEIFRISTPVFIGYGGNDGSMMGYLEKVNHFNNIFWCEKKDVNISSRVKAFLDKNDGKLVEIDGFDELMFSLQYKLKLPNLDVSIEAIAKKRVDSYRKKFEEIQKNQLASPDKEVQDAAQRIVQDAGNSWWAWELKARAANNANETDKIYKEGLKEFPNSAELNNSYAVFLEEINHTHDKAEDYYKKALELYPGNAMFNRNYAQFLHSIRKDYDEAEKYYKKALELAPNNTFYNGSYAQFLHGIRKDYDEAEKYYKKALELDPNNAIYNGSYALFLHSIRKDYDEAEKYYKKALELGPNDTFYNGNYAQFLHEIRKDYDEAEKYYKKALELGPNDTFYNGNYAQFLHEIRKNYDEAEKYYKKALELDPNVAIYNGSYSFFLHGIRKDYDEAEKYYKKALELDPNNTFYNGNYALFLHEIRKDYDEAEKYYKKALELAPNVAIYNGNYALFLHGIRKDYDEAEKYYKKALELDPNVAIHNGNYAQFLHEIRKDYDEAEKYYKKVFELDPNVVIYNGNYASFLREVRKDYDEAEKYYKKALELDPNNANNNSNYAGFLLSVGKNAEAIKYMETALQYCNADGLMAELQFYNYAHFEEKREEAFKNLKDLLCSGVRSLNFNLQDNVDRAIKDGHPDPEMLQRLADILTKDAAMGDLCKG